MEFYNGDLLDITNLDSSSYLQLNNCGIHTLQNQRVTYRQKGRCDYHITYIAKGQCDITYENKTYSLTHGFVLYPPDVPQKYVDHENTVRMWIHFNGFNMEEILSDAKLKGGVYPIAASPILEKMFIQLVEEHTQKLSVSNEKGLLLSIINMLGKLIHNQSSANVKISEAITFITTNYNMSINIQELANSCNLSQSRFMKLFNEHTGMAPLAYQQMLRIKNSMSLLATTNLSISDICTLSGYQDPLYFSRVFRKHVGISPRHYRQFITSSTNINRNCCKMDDF